MKLALRKERLAAIIRANGHLMIEGDETIEELRDAVTFLYHGHISQRECHKPESGIPIGELITDIRVVIPARMRRRSATNVDLSSVYL